MAEAPGERNRTCETRGRVASPDRFASSLEVVRALVAGPRRRAAPPHPEPRDGAPASARGSAPQRGEERIDGVELGRPGETKTRPAADAAGFAMWEPWVGSWRIS